MEGAGLVAGIPKYAGQIVRQKASSPKLLVLNNALISSQIPGDISSVRSDPEMWGRLVESAIGNSIANKIKGTGTKLYYWSAGNAEVDFVIARGRDIVAIEVKSGRKITSLPGMIKFSKEFSASKKFLVGTGGMPIEEFLLMDPLKLLDLGGNINRP